MAVWRIIDTRPLADPAAPGGYDSNQAWEVDVQHRQTGERETLRVDRAGNEPFDAFPEECRRAMQTQGRSAVQLYSDAPRMPRRIVLTTDGIRPDFGDAGSRPPGH